MEQIINKFRGLTESRIFFFILAYFIFNNAKLQIYNMIRINKAVNMASPHLQLEVVDNNYSAREECKKLFR